MVIKAKILGVMLVTALALSPAHLVLADTADVKPAVNGDALHQGADGHHGPWEHKPSMAKILNLTDDQVKQLKDSHQKQREAMKSVFEQMKANRSAFDTEIAKATPDMNKINDLQVQLKSIQSQMADNHLNALLDIKKILTPEQFDGFLALKKEHALMKFQGHHSWKHKDGFHHEGDGHMNGLAGKDNNLDQGDGDYISEDEE